MKCTIKIYDGDKLTNDINTDKAVVITDNCCAIMIEKSNIADIIYIAAKIKYTYNKLLEILTEKYPNISLKDLEQVIDITLPLFDDDSITTAESNVN